MNNLPSGILLSFPNDDNIFGDVIGAGEAKNTQNFYVKIFSFVFTITLLRIS
jgi:hypothetical protein